MTSHRNRERKQKERRKIRKRNVTAEKKYVMLEMDFWENTCWCSRQIANGEASMSTDLSAAPAAAAAPTPPLSPLLHESNRVAQFIAPLIRCAAFGAALIAGRYHSLLGAVWLTVSAQRSNEIWARQLWNIKLYGSNILDCTVWSETGPL